MHKLNVLILGPVSFVSTLNELKTYLKFNSLFKETKGCKSNYWLQTIILNKNISKMKNKLLYKLHKEKIFSRPVWKLISELKPYKKCSKMNLSGSKEIYSRTINLPSSPDLAVRN